MTADYTMTAPQFHLTGEGKDVRIFETTPVVGRDGIAYIIRRYRTPTGDKYSVMTAHHKGYISAPITVARIYNVLARRLATPALAYGPWYCGQNPLGRSHRSDYRRKQELNRMAQSIVRNGSSYRNPKYHYPETVSHEVKP